MKIKQRTEVSMVTHEITVVRFRGVATHCEQCGEMTPHVSLNEAVSILSISEAAVLRLAGKGEIHSLPNGEGPLQLCFNSTAAQAHR